MNKLKGDFGMYTESVALFGEEKRKNLCFAAKKFQEIFRQMNGKIRF